MGKDAGILFADISGTTRLYRTRASGESQYQLERCLKRMERSIDGNGGRLLNSAADELTAVFPGPDDAVLAAIDMQRRIEDLPPVSGVRLSIRIGVYAGELSASDGGPGEAARKVGRVLLSLAGIGQIITCGEVAALLGRAQRELLHSVDNIARPTDLGDCPVYQVRWHPDAARLGSPGSPAISVPSGANRAAPAGPAAGAERPQAPKLKLPHQLALRWGDRALLVDQRSPKISIGRDKACTLMLKGNKASRLHAIIERRPDGTFTLTDDSTNGTFLMTEGLGENRVHSETVVLSGRGKVAFGHSVTADDGEIVEFEVV